MISGIQIFAGVTRAAAVEMVDDYFAEYAAACRALSGQGSGLKTSADARPAGDDDHAAFDIPGSRTPKRSKLPA